MGLIEILFAIIVVAAVIAVLFDPEQGGMLVMTVALVVAFWQLALIVGPSPWLGVFAVFVAAAVKIVDELAGGEVFGDLSLVQLVDIVLTRRMGRGGGGGPPPGGQQGETEQQTQTGPGPIWTDEDDDD